MHLPLAFKLTGRHCLLVGCREEAVRKARLLRKAEAKIQLLAPAPSTDHIALELQQIVADSGGQIALAAKDIAAQFAGLLQPAVLCVIASDELKQQLGELVAICRERKCPVNVVDQPEFCDFTFPALVDRSPLSVAISSSGTAPVLARQLRATIEAMLPAQLGELARFAYSFRSSVAEKLKDGKQRRRFWEAFFNGPVASMIYQGNQAKATDIANALLQDCGQAIGEVYLVGAGPGDPELLTLQALRLLQHADVIVYDRLINKKLLDYARRDAKLLYVGKARDSHTVPQEGINTLLLEYARSGNRVLRLKGGDPFTFGRGGEEIEQLAAAGIPFKVVPGVTAASGCASYAGIPLTHRDYAQSVQFVTGHLKDGALDLAWPKLVQTRQTLVIYMGVHALEQIQRELITNGLAQSTPVAIIEQGTNPQQRVVTGELALLKELAEQHNIHPPSIVIVGDVVKLHKKLAWYAPDKQAGLK